MIRRQLDKQFTQLKNLKNVVTPPIGWIESIRKSLGITRKQLAEKLNVRQQTIEKMEHSEVNHSITLKSLHRVAHALNCKLVYVLIPEKNLEDIFNHQVSKKAEEIIQTTHHSMVLENQNIENDEADEQLKMIIEDIKRRKNISFIWDDK